MADAKRIQRRRAKGWRMPEGAIYVGRGSKWGNPFVVGIDGPREECLRLYVGLIGGYLCISKSPEHIARQEWAHAATCDAAKELKGKDLVCWCPLDKLCHADVLLVLANGGSIPDESKPQIQQFN